MDAIQILGRIRVLRDGREIDLGPPARRAVFGLLVLAEGKPVPRAELIGTLWGGDPPAAATNVLQTHVKHLRRLLEPGREARAPSILLPSVGDGYALLAAADLSRFRELARGGEWQAALALWHGPPLADVPVLAAHPKVVGLAAERRQVLARHAERMIAAGRAEEVLPVLAEDAAAHPFDELAQARLIRGYGHAGQRAQAFDVYDYVRRRLGDELGVDPGPELVAAYQALLQDAQSVEPEVVACEMPRQIPADVPGFLGRRAELSRLDALPRPAVCVICGTAGVGKTALALHWAQNTPSPFPDGQFYVDLRGYDPEQSMAPAEALARLLEAMGVAAHDIPLDLGSRTCLFRSRVAGKQLLLLLDNASTVEQVRPLLPGASRSLVLVTSRDSMAGLVALHGAHRLELDLLPGHVSLALLRRLIGPRVDAEPEAAQALAAQCAHLPLALRVAAELAATSPALPLALRVAAELAATSPALPLADLVAELADGRRRLDLLDAGGDGRAAVRVVFSWSYRHLEPDAAKAFRRLGLFVGTSFDAGIVAALVKVGTGEARRLLDRLARAHLVQRGEDGRFLWHDLLRAYASELVHEIDGPEEVERAIDRLLDHYPSGERFRTNGCGAEAEARQGRR